MTAADPARAPTPAAEAEGAAAPSPLDLGPDHVNELHRLYQGGVEAYWADESIETHNGPDAHQAGLRAIAEAVEGEMMDQVVPSAAAGAGPSAEELAEALFHAAAWTDHTCIWAELIRDRTTATQGIVRHFRETAGRVLARLADRPPTSAAAPDAPARTPSPDAGDAVRTWVGQRTGSWLDRQGAEELVRLAGAGSPGAGRALREAAQRLETANDRLCAVRSRATYHAMIADPGGPTAMLELDDARHALRAALAQAGRDAEGWELLDTCPSKGEPIWAFGGRRTEPERAPADGEYWRYERDRGSMFVPTHWRHDRVPAPPAGARP